MPLTTRADCQDKAKVWDELKRSYTGVREWKKDDLKFMAPPMDKLDKTTPPYTVQMVSSPPAETPAGAQGNWRYVEIVGKDKTTIRVGKVWDH